jgi:protein SCO1/2
MTPRAQRLAVLMLASLGFGAGVTAALWSAGVLPLGGARAVQERPRIQGDFTLLGADGAEVRWRTLGDRLQLVFFGFTHCPEACPNTLAAANAALGSLGEEAGAVRLLLVSVDPARDSPAVMADYVANFGPRVVGFTGSEAQIAVAAAAFGVFYERMAPMMPGDEDYMVNHTASLFLLGPRDEILEIIPYGAPSAEIAGAIRRHL